MKTTHRQLRKGITSVLLAIETLLFLCLLILFSIDLPAATTTTMMQFKYFMIVFVSMMLTCCCHFTLVKFGNRKVLHKFLEENK